MKKLNSEKQSIIFSGTQEAISHDVGPELRTGLTHPALLAPCG